MKHIWINIHKIRVPAPQLNDLENVTDTPHLNAMKLSNIPIQLVQEDSLNTSEIVGLHQLIQASVVCNTDMV